MTKVITYGTFDLFHQGHYNLLKRAKELGDYLIVGVTTEHFDELRGKINVVDSLVDRIENVKKTGFADMIIVEDHEGQKIEDIQKYGVDIFTVGSDWVGTFDYLNTFCKVHYLERTPNISSTMLRGDTFKIIKLGIVGTGRIAERFVLESRFSSGVVVTSAYNPIEESAQQFKEHCSDYDINVYTDNYEEFLKEVDAIYIASTHETHSDYTRIALKAGKHVLCEKPLAFTKKESEELYELATYNRVILMEAIKAAYCPGFQQLLNVVASGKIGEIKDVEASFTRIARVESRERSDAKYGGAFLEFGGNALMPIVKILGKDYESITFDSIDNELGTDDYTKVQIRYPNAMATAKVGMAVKSEGQLIVAGTKGYVIAQSPWWLTQKFDVRYEDEKIIEHYEPKFVGDGLRYEINEFIMKIRGTGSNDYKLTASESIAITGMTEEFVRRRGIVNSMENENRIYAKKVDVSGDSIKEFYDRRAKKFVSGEKSQYTTVLLGDSNPEYAKKWHEFEKNYVLNFLNVDENHSVLDIGCGIGRWAENVLPTCGRYVGTDFSAEMVKAASKRYEDNSKATFVNSNFQDIFTNEVINEKKFDSVIIAGVSMYINEADLRECYKKLADLVNTGAIIYIEESVGVKERLTLNHIWSESLDDNYDAIYRTREEYLDLLSELIEECEVVKEGYFAELDKKEMSETSHWYAILKKK